MTKTTAPTPTTPGHWVVPKFGPPSVLKWETLPEPTPPAKDELAIRILAAGISGSDNVWRAGGYPKPFHIEPGFTPGYDFVGVVDAIGEDVRDFEKGDLVANLCIFGGYATHKTIPAKEAIKLRKEDDVVKMAALTLNYMTAYGMLKRSGVSLGPGSSILIGSVSGGVGTAVAQLVKSFDMRITMLGTCSKAKFDYVKSLGITPIDRHTTDLANEVKKLNGGKGVDVAYDSVGSEESLNASLASTNQGKGRVVCISTLAAVKEDGSGLVETEFNAFEFIDRQERITFFVVTYGYYLKDKELFLRDFEDVAEKVRVGSLSPVVGRLFGLSQAVEANKVLVEGAGGLGKMLFLVDEELAKANELSL
ncbi:MAG: hypothetical protein M1812_008487 [Candelaria pacifica]|nr:MAG: hypothetical protein M1812_008487 [Candelaria pacifica]